MGKHHKYETAGEMLAKKAKKEKDPTKKAAIQEKAAKTDAKAAAQAVKIEKTKAKKIDRAAKIEKDPATKKALEKKATKAEKKANKMQKKVDGSKKKAKDAAKGQEASQKRKPSPKKGSLQEIRQKAEDEGKVKMAVLTKKLVAKQSAAAAVAGARRKAGNSIKEKSEKGKENLHKASVAAEKDGKTRLEKARKQEAKDTMAKMEKAKKKLIEAKEKDKKAQAKCDAIEKKEEDAHSRFMECDKQAQALTVITKKAEEEDKKAGEALSKAKTAEKTQKGITKAGDEKAQDDAVKKVKDAKDAEAKSKTDLKAKRKSLKETPLHCITLKGISEKIAEKAKEELKACKNDFEVVEKDRSRERAAKLRETQHAEVMQKLKAK